jgi:signal transduction histidine kinase/ActR/RegA family two-component response regulator
MPRTLRGWREYVLRAMLRGLLVFGALALLGGINTVLADSREGTLQWSMVGMLIGIYIIAYAAVVFANFARNLSFPVRTGMLLVVLYGLGAIGLSQSGLSGDGRIFLFFFVVISAILFDLSYSLAALTLSLVTLAVAAWALVTSQISIPAVRLANSTDASAWLSGGLVFLLLSVAAITSVTYLMRSLNRSLILSQSMVEKLQAQQEALEQEIKERTAKMERRAAQLQVAAEIARDTSATRGLDELLNHAVSLVRDRFGFYHAGIFLVDERGEYAVLQAAAGEAGDAMLKQGHRLKVDEVGIVGYVTGIGQPRIALDVGADAVHFKNPFLPETRSELALPLKVGGRVIGALDVQSQRAAAFDQDDMAVFQTMADQLAVAIENARLYQAERSRYREAEALRQAALTLTTLVPLDQVFERILAELQYVVPYDSASVQLLKGDQLEIIGGRGFSNLPELLGICIPAQGDNPNKLVLESREPVTVGDARARYSGFRQEPHVATDIRSWLGVPLLVGDRLIGMLALDKHQADFYTETHARAARAYAAQAAVAIENARLYKDLQDQMRALELAQARLVQSEKLAAIGELVAGVAHELNNPLTLIIGFAELLRRSPVSDETRQDLEKIVAQSRRAAGIVRSLLDFARQRPSERKLVQANDMMNSTLDLLAYELRTHNIERTVRLAPDLPLTLADPYQLQQVFVNLVNNARQAMSETHGGGHLTITSELGPSTFVNGGRDDAPVIRITIQDDGPGIPPDLLPRIFDPFFTTKSPGEGTGLGLSVCHGIIGDHGGHIWAENRPQGATFFVELPVVQPAAPSAAMPPRQSGEAEAPRGDVPSGSSNPKTTLRPSPAETARILLIDDESGTVEVLARILRAQGYQADAVTDGETALRRLAGTRYDLVLCDIRMPGLSGPEIYRQLEVCDPEMARRIIFITGDTMSVGTRRFLEESGTSYLRKPFDLDEFMTKVRAALKDKKLDMTHNES